MTSSLRDHLLDDWRACIRTKILSKRSAAALERGEPAAPLDAFAGDEHELAHEIECGLETMIDSLERQREATEEDFFSCEYPDPDGDDWISQGYRELAGEDDLAPA